MNRQTGVYKTFGRVPDVRMQILFTAPPGWCLHPDSSVTMEDGRVVPIRDIRIGDRLRPGFYFSGEENIVEDISIREGEKEIIHIHPQNLRCSPEHKIATYYNGWKMAGDITTDDVLISHQVIDGGKELMVRLVKSRIEKITRHKTRVPLIDISTTCSNFLANGVVVHNSKSMFLKQLLNADYGIINTGGIPTRFMGSCTEAGWTGSSLSAAGGNNMQLVMGVAQRYKDGIVGMEEFAAIQALMESTHSAHLEQALAMSLFEGEVEKDLKGVTISYHTDITLWAGNQIMNFNLSGGLFRRFFHVYWTPRLREARDLEKAVWEGDNIPPDQPRLQRYRTELMKITNVLPNIKTIEFTDKFKRLLAGVPHFEKNLYKNFGIGFTIMSDNHVPANLVVDATPELSALINQAIVWRKQLLADPRGFQVEMLLQDVGADFEPVLWSEIRELNLLFSVSYYDTDEIIRNLMRAGRVKYDPVAKKLRLS